ncbi:DUF3422 family protein [Shimia biformata]|uniref:DUF3422 family protein n=1 Tax=Shimia biformata TaxID=1294299 RepID=UPI001951C62F|nr:DUF3422 domain-containing protein [Shimia biformata]
MSPIHDHPLRYRLSNELHARPFPSVAAPAGAVFLAMKTPADAVGGAREAERAHLLALLDRFGAAHPQPDATHYSGQLGRHVLKWEQHTEFVTYTVFSEGLSARPFDPAEFEVFPADWLADAPGLRMTSILIRIEALPEDAALNQKLRDWFVPESLAVSRVLDASAVIAADFRIDVAGHQRMALFAAPDTGPRRQGRIVQRLTEIETYKSMSMLGFERARRLAPRLGELDEALTELMRGMRTGEGEADTALDRLLDLSTETEGIAADSAFRFGATGAYEAIVSQRIEVLREERFSGRQTFGEFMMRRYEPAMRTVKSTQSRLDTLSDRAIRAGDLLRTKVDVAREAQNQALLASMDRRADAALRLQETVEGLSVVAISYYAVSLAGYLTSPFADTLGLGKTELKAVLTVPVVLLVWLMVRRIRGKMH